MFLSPDRKTRSLSLMILLALIGTLPACEGPTLMPTPNLHIQAEDDLFKNVDKDPNAVGVFIFGYLVFFGLIIHAALTSPL